MGVILSFVKIWFHTVRVSIYSDLSKNTYSKSVFYCSKGKLDIVKVSIYTCTTYIYSESKVQYKCE